MNAPANRKSGLVIAVIAVVALVALGVVIYRGGAIDNRSDGSSSSTARTGGAASTGGKLSTDAVLNIAPGSGTRQAPKRTLNPSLQEYANAKAYGPLYQRLKAADSRTPEEQWMLAKILERCAKNTDNPRQNPRWALGGEESKARFVASLSDKDPNRDRRIAAFEKINVDTCAGISDVEVSDKDIYKLIETGAAGGDPKSRAALVEKDLMNQMRGPDGKIKWEPGKMPTISDAQIETVKQVFASGDPYAMQDALRVFSFPLQNLSLRTGPNELPVDMSAWYGAVDLLTCDFGRPCGPDSQQLLQGCAMQGRCDASDTREYMFFYTASPSASQRIGEYNIALAEAARTGNWSYFTFHRGPAPSMAGYQLGK